MEALVTAAAPPLPAVPPSPAVSLDAHYYAGGLRIQPIGQARHPAWVPPEPERFAGYRHEVPLAPGDRVVEAARYLVNGRRLQWLAVYERLRDATFGDRGNYCGVGLWSVDIAIRSARPLLQSLSSLTGTLLSGGLEGVETAGRSFLDGEWLSTFLAPALPMPPLLAGWSFAAAPGPAKQVLWADQQPDGAEWDLVADQLTRMALLPGPTPDHARTVMLLRAPGAGSAAPADLMPLSGDVGSELAAYLPTALATTAAESAALREQLTVCSGERDGARAELARLDQELDGAKIQLNEARQLAADSDPQRRLGRIDDGIRQLSEKQGQSATAMAELRNLVAGQRQVLTQVLDDHLRHSRRLTTATRSGDAVAGPDLLRPVARPRTFADDWGLTVTWAGVLGALLVVALLGIGLTVYERSDASTQRAEVSRLNDELAQRDQRDQRYTNGDQSTIDTRPVP